MFQTAIVKCLSFRHLYLSLWAGFLVLEERRTYVYSSGCGLDFFFFVLPDCLTSTHSTSSSEGAVSLNVPSSADEYLSGELSWLSTLTGLGETLLLLPELWCFCLPPVSLDSRLTGWVMFQSWLMYYRFGIASVLGNVLQGRYCFSLG